MAKIIMITGGQRSGKSRMAEEMALAMSDTPIYIATARIFDEDFSERVKIHRQRRGPQWTTYEESVNVASTPLDDNDTVLFDCITLWATNCYFELGEDSSKTLDFMKRQLMELCPKCKNIIFVTNEIGMGGVSENALQRRFTDLQGSINQYLASIANEVHLCVSGIDIKIK